MNGIKEAEWSTNDPSDLSEILRFDLFSNKLLFGDEKKSHTCIS